MQIKKVFLASQSPRRKALLESLGLRVIVIPADPNFDSEALETPLPNEDPAHYVERVALKKRDYGLTRLHDLMFDEPPNNTDLLVAADTTVALGQEIFGKPANAQHAAEMLHKLSGKTHTVHTAIAITRVDKLQERMAVVSSQVTFAVLSEEWINGYVCTGEPLDKAGAYAIQGVAQAMIPKIHGSYSAIVGLPLYETHRFITALISR